jgi:hypothetical protein
MTRSNRASHAMSEFRARYHAVENRPAHPYKRRCRMPRAADNAFAAVLGVGSARDQPASRAVALAAAAGSDPSLVDVYLC